MSEYQTSYLAKSTHEEPQDKRHQAVKGIAAGALISVAGAAAIVVFGPPIVDAYKKSQAQEHAKVTRMNQAILPTAEKIAGFALQHSTVEQRFNIGKTTSIMLGTGEAGHTTISVEIKNVKGKPLSAANVSDVILIHYAADPTKDGNATPDKSEQLKLEGESWTASFDYNDTPPYGDLDHGIHFSSTEYPGDIRSFGDRLSAAEDIATFMRSDYVDVQP